MGNRDRIPDDKEIPARTTSRRLNVRLLYFYLAILLYNIWVLMNIISKIIIIADNLRIFMASILIKIKNH